MLTTPQNQDRLAVSDTQDSQSHFFCSIPHGELPPPPPRACFGRDGLIETIVGLAENLTPIALIGAGGIGKTSIALTVLHHNRTKERFGGNRWFVRCDQFPASQTHFLSRLSEVIGAGVKNPVDLTPLRPFLSAREMILFLDNAESILDPQGAGAQEIYALVGELCQLKTLCLCITSQISTAPPDCKCLDIPTLSADSACHTLYCIYDGDRRSNQVKNILQQLDFHPLSITLLATIAKHNRWDINRLAREWERQRTRMLHIQHNQSLVTTIELSLASPMFQELGSNALDLLGVIAFFPQGIDEKNIGWLFPTIPNGRSVFDKFCILSLTLFVVLPFIPLSLSSLINPTPPFTSCRFQPTSSPSSNTRAFIIMITFTPPFLSPPKPVLRPSSPVLTAPSWSLSSQTLPLSTSSIGMVELSRPLPTGPGRLHGLPVFRGLAMMIVMTGFISLVWMM